MRKNWEDESSERELRGALKDALRPVEGETNVDFCRRLITAGNFGAWDDGQGEMLVDTFSASALVAVHDSISESLRPKLLGMPMLKAITVSFKLMNKK
jgi:hypothetical protein